MKKELIKVVYNDETIVTVDNEILKDNFVKCMLNWSSEMSEVNLKRSSDKEIRKAKKFTLQKGEGMKLLDGSLFLLFPKGTIIYLFI